jgi:HAD superfamily hydrolase (TIGR01549 family)
MDKIPYGQLESLFLDVGNTMISINFDWVCLELKKKGVNCEPAVLQRAEAASRPIISDRMEDFREKKGLEVFQLYLTMVFRQLPAGIISGESRISQIAADLVPILFSEGNAMRLWSYVLPGVHEALEQFKAMGLQLVVVSNADGSVERQLMRDDLISYFDAVIDSHIVGFEKPDPRIFQHALDVSGAVAERTLYVGDIYRIDVVGARSAGLHAILLDPYSDWPDLDCPKIPNLLALSKMISEQTS